MAVASNCFGTEQRELDIVAWGLPNVLGASIMLPTNLDIHQWNTTVDTAEDKQTVEFLQYRILADYQGPVPSPLLCKSPLRKWTPQRPWAQDIMKSHNIM